MYTLITPAKSEFPQLLSVWESSVSATHDFLCNGDMAFFKKIIIEKDVFAHVLITAAIDENKNIIGFSGVSGDNLEMLFVREAYIGKGVGKLLMLHAINNLHVTKVDVNEQNTRAADFYRQFGFTAVSRSEVDSTGKPYPILHMQL